MSFFTFVRKAFGALPDIAWFGKLGAQMLGSAFTGHDVPEDAHAAVKGISGIWGFKDERQMLVKFERLERRVCGATKVVQTFLGSHYSTDTPPDLTLSAKAYILRQRRRFRDVVVDMGETEGAKVGKETFILNGKDNSGNAYTLNREKDIHNEPKDNGVDLLERMYRILSKNTGTEEEKKMECVNHLKAANVPLVDPDMVTRLNNAQEATIRKVGEVAPTVTRLAREGGRLTAEQVHTASERLHAYRTKQERQMTWWQKFIDRL